MKTFVNYLREYIEFGKPQTLYATQGDQIFLHDSSDGNTEHQHIFKNLSDMDAWGRINPEVKLIHMVTKESINPNDPLMNSRQRKLDFDKRLKSISVIEKHFPEHKLVHYDGRNPHGLKLNYDQYRKMLYDMYEGE